jgi:hypothetical protein
MNKQNVWLKNRIGRGGLLALLLIFCLTVPSYSRVDSSVFQSDAKELPGLTGQNNVQFAFGRYILTAPYAPTFEVNANTKLKDLDNNQLFVFDSKKVSNEPLVFNLGDCYYPTKVIFDENSNTVFIRCTQIIEKADGDFATYAVIKYLHMNLAENGKPVFDSVAPMIRIPGVGKEFAEEAPDDLLINNKGIFIFSNGASISTYSLLQGFIYKVDFIAPEDYDASLNSISYIGLDTDSDTLTITTNKKVVDKDQNWKHSSELYFYKLKHDGTVDQLTRLKPDAFEDGVCLPAGSAVAIAWDGEAEKVAGENEGFAYFVGSDGNLYQTSWDYLTGLNQSGHEVFGSIVKLDFFQELSQDNAEYLSSVHTYFDKPSKSFELLKQGFISSIHRPVNNGEGRGKIGKIHRPVNVRRETGATALVLAQFGKKNKLIKGQSFVDVFAEQGGILNLFSDDKGNEYISTYSGNIYEMVNPQSIDQAEVKLLGKIGERLAGIAYFPSREVFVAISSMEADETGNAILSPGAILLAKRKADNNFLSFVEKLQDFSQFDQPLAIGISSIRRPCNIGLH